MDLNEPVDLDGAHSRSDFRFRIQRHVALTDGKFFFEVTQVDVNVFHVDGDELGIIGVLGVYVFYNLKEGK